MVISYNSQLGLRMNSLEMQVSFLKDLMNCQELLKDLVGNKIKELDNLKVDGEMVEVPEDSWIVNDLLDVNFTIENHRKDAETRERVTLAIGERSMIDGENSSYYFICESVYKCAELIKINDAFTGRTLKDIKFGKYTYLMGKHITVRFLVGIGAIKGIYWDETEGIAFEWGIEMESGNYYFDGNFGGDWGIEFAQIMKILTFVELGDIEVVELPAGRNNGASKKSGDKIANTSNNTVFVVDSSWNKLIIRTEGFAVRGHLRLQPCGPNMADRKLIWIDAFAKNGFTRRAKAEIIHS